MRCVSRAAARCLLLHQQGLLAPPPRAAKKADVLACIRRMGLLQIDTIHVIARSPYLVLYSRLGTYDPHWLEQVHAAGKLFEYWSHAMCWIPTEDWPLWRGLMIENFRAGGANWGRVQDWLAKNRQAADMVLAHIREHGAVKSADFENQKETSASWWNWKLEKAALEYTFWMGELMIARRDKFQRVYDLRERVLPHWSDEDAICADTAQVELMRRSALHLGVATEPWLRDYYRMKQDVSKAAIQRLLESGELLPAQIEGVKGTAYVHRDLLALLKKAEAGKLEATRTALLSPFDPIVWDRRRGRELFGFDYTIEIYTPEAKRVYGYFVLPILHRGQLIGRLDPKAHRKDGVFEVRALHLEQGAKLDAQDWTELAQALQDCANWHATPLVALASGTPALVARPLKRALAALPR